MWIELASKSEPFWWNRDNSGNVSRRLMSVEISYDRLSANRLLQVFIGRLRLTFPMRAKKGT